MRTHYTDLDINSLYVSRNTFAPEVEVLVQSKDKESKYEIYEVLGSAFNSDLKAGLATGLKGVEFSLNEGFDAGSCTVTFYDRDRRLANLFFDFDQGTPPTTETKQEEVITPVSTTQGNYYEPSLTPRRNAWLDTIAWAEGTYQYNNQNGYNVIFSFKTFSSYTDHPRIRIRSGGYTSDASGRYQFLTTTWDGLNLPSFEPKNQDLGAIELTRQRGALGDVDAGRIAQAIFKCSYEWASFPPSRYGQPTKTEASLLDFYNQRYAYYTGGGSANSASSQATQSTTSYRTVRTVVQGRPASNKYVGGYMGIKVKLNRPSGTSPSQVIYTFILTGCDYNESGNELLVYGKAAGFALNQKILNTAYTDVTLPELFKRFCATKGIELEMDEVEDEPVYEYFPVVGKSLWRALVDEAERRGYFVSSTGNTENDNNTFLVGRKISVLLPNQITKRVENNKKPIYTIKNNYNAPVDIKFSFRIEEHNDGDALSKSDRTISVEAAAEIDAVTGTYKDTAISKVYTNFPEETEEEEKLLDGTPLNDSSPVYKDEFREAQEQIDSINKANLVRLNGMTFDCTLPLDSELLKLIPNSFIATSGYQLDLARDNDFTTTLSKDSKDSTTNSLNKVFILDSISHTINESGFTTNIKGKSPVKPKAQIF